MFKMRPAIAADYDFLVDMLVEAVNWSEDMDLPRHVVMADPEFARYVEGWPRHGDVGLIAEADGRPIGAVWLRSFTADEPGFGYVADDVPELSIAVAPEWRGRGVGRGLLREMTTLAQEMGLRAISVSVERGNHAADLYRGEGYRFLEPDSDSGRMVLELP